MILIEREVEEEEAKQFCEYKGIMWGGEICIKNYSAEQSTEILLNSWKAYVKKFGQPAKRKEKDSGCLRQCMK